MYISPELHRIGNAEEVVLGLALDGLDLDGTRFLPDLEFPSPSGDASND